MNKNILKLTDIIPKGEFKGKTIKSIIEKNRKDLFKIIQMGYYFTDDVYDYAGYKHTIRDINTSFQFVENKTKKEDKIYPKDSESLHKILHSLLTIEKLYDNENDNNINEFNEDE